LVPKAPLAEVLHLHRREIALAAGSVLVAFGFVYMAGTYLSNYAQSHLGYSRNVILFVGVLGGLASIVSVALSAALSDRVGRRRIMLVGWAGCLPWSFVVIPLINTGKPILYAVAIVGMYALHAIGAGPMAAFIPELFSTRNRYSGAALSVNLAGVIGGALPPLIAGTLVATFGSWAIGLMLAALALTSVACTYVLPETSGTALRTTQGVHVGHTPAEVELPGSRS